MDIAQMSTTLMIEVVAKVLEPLACQICFVVCDDIIWETMHANNIFSNKPWNFLYIDNGQVFYLNSFREVIYSYNYKVLMANSGRQELGMFKSLVLKVQ